MIICPKTTDLVLSEKYFLFITSYSQENFPPDKERYLFANAKIVVDVDDIYNFFL